METYSARCGRCGPQNAQQFNDAKHFAYRDRVKPDGAAARRLKHGGKKTQTLRQSREVPAVAQSPVK